MFLGRQISGGRATEISKQIVHIWVTINHVAKFGDDQPSDFGD